MKNTIIMIKNHERERISASPFRFWKMIKSNQTSKKPSTTSNKKKNRKRVVYFSLCVNKR